MQTPTAILLGLTLVAGSIAATPAVNKITGVPVEQGNGRYAIRSIGSLNVALLDTKTGEVSFCEPGRDLGREGFTETEFELLYVRCSNSNAYQPIVY